MSGMRPAQKLSSSSSEQYGSGSFFMNVMEKVDRHVKLVVDTGDYEYWDAGNMGKFELDETINDHLERLGIPCPKGALSPLHKVTVAPEKRYQFSIPEDATHFAFVTAGRWSRTISCHV